MAWCSRDPGPGQLFNGSAHLAELGSGAVLPVVGGTGRYAHVSGVVTMLAAADGSSTARTFNIRTHK